ncbi:MAG: hypothetical protein F6K42_01315 [Leptolyngbya sp. SIO1D8]|nr:hypothetical protein [Leptolyngbya sp. SIO1D8]
MSKFPLRYRWIICQRFALMLMIWLAILLGIYEFRDTSEQANNPNTDLRRLAIYSILMRANR